VCGSKYVHRKKPLNPRFLLTSHPKWKLFSVDLVHQHSRPKLKRVVTTGLGKNEANTKWISDDPSFFVIPQPTAVPFTGCEGGSCVPPCLVQGEEGQTTVINFSFGGVRCIASAAYIIH
jgi:hypothetical protein